VLTVWAAAAQACYGAGCCWQRLQGVAQAAEGCLWDCVGVVCLLQCVGVPRCLLYPSSDVGCPEVHAVILAGEVWATGRQWVASGVVASCFVHLVVPLPQARAMHAVSLPVLL